MVAQTIDAWKREAAALFVNNTSGDIEADEVLTILNNLADSVTFKDPTAPFIAPAITAFSISGQVADVDAGFNLSGTQTFLFNVSQGDNVTGNLTLAQEGTNLATDIDPKDSQVDQAITTFTLSAGQTQTFTLSGTDTQSTAFSRNLVFTARTADQYIYYGIKTSSGSSGIVTDTNQRIRTTTLSHNSFTIPTFADNQHLWVIQEATANDFTRIMIDGVDQIGAFTKFGSIATINGKTFEGWVSDNALIGSVVSGELVEIIR